MSNSKPTLGYWGIRGLGQPIRVLAAYIGLELNEKRYSSMEEWQAEKLSLGLDFPNLPYLIDGQIKLTETRAIIKHVARQFGSSSLYPSTPDEMRTCDMVENALWDMWFGLLRYCTTGRDDLKTYFENDISKKIGYLNAFLENKKYILGDKLSYVDFLLYEMLYHYTTYQATYLENYATLQAFKNNFEKIPAVASYISSKEYIKGPCINPMAKIAF